MKRDSKIQVTIITGFLGAGKTTFINNILGKYPTIQFALVENEFGDVAIDSKLIKGVDTSQLFELKQGCICCTITDEYELVLQELAERFPDVEHLLIETTGIADPAPVIQPFFRDKELQELYEYNGTICLIDALNFSAQSEKDISLKQLIVADLILINKTETLSSELKNDFLVEIQKLNTYAKIAFVEFGNAHTIELAQLQQKEKTHFDLLRFSSSHVNITTKSIFFSNPVNRATFVRWLTYTLDVYKNQIYRMKGIVYFQGEPFEYIVQGVGGNYEITEGDIAFNQQESQLFFIGKLDGVQLRFNS